MAATPADAAAAAQVPPFVSPPVHKLMQRDTLYIDTHAHKYKLVAENNFCTNSFMTDAPWQERPEATAEMKTPCETLLTFNQKAAGKLMCHGFRIDASAFSCVELKSPEHDNPNWEAEGQVGLIETKNSGVQITVRFANPKRTRAEVVGSAPAR